MNRLEPPLTKLTPSEALLETILRSCNADQYLTHFRENNIETNVLRNLEDEDLFVIGIEDENSRKNILEHLKNLQIPTEQKLDLSVDNNYASLVLNQTSVQLNKHHANLAYILSYTNKNAVDLCYIKLGQAGRVLKNCICSFDKEIYIFKKDIIKQPKRREHKQGLLLITTIGFFSLAVISYVKFIKPN